MSFMSASSEPVPLSPSSCKYFSSSNPTSVVKTAMRSPDSSTAGDTDIVTTDDVITQVLLAADLQGGM